MHYECFTWRGEPILDIDQWAKDRGERMVHYKAERDVPSPWGPNCLLAHEEYESRMPQCFWDGLRMDGWKYTELNNEQT